MSKVVLSALSVLGLAACAVSSTDEEVLGESQEALIGLNGGFYGSDTLFNAITDALNRSIPSLPITYLGTGTGRGEQCLEGTGSAPCNTKAQTIAPMSRDLNGTCDSGQKSNRVALDAVYIWSDKLADQTATGATTASVKGAFCGDGDGDATSCAAFDTWGEFTSGSTSPSNSLVVYRRDDLSGTTDIFKALTGCTVFCSNVQIVVDDEIAGPRLSTDTPGTSSLVPVPCAATDSATDCIGKLVGANVNAIGYAGGDAKVASGSYENKYLRVNSIEPSVTNIRKLITDPSNAYPYSRFLYLNEGNGTRDAAEQDFLDWIIANKLNFEDALTDAGFISCTGSSLTPLACGSTGTTCPRNSSL
ncbi:PstS family phosphate ABC transporter substrate-binding protein [Sorangium sp. So ce887]|uniref:PstS family phosphate ABC transporter substrate-binding protein n=1 Tax=Sorangium sp. So ce887 TaxID=3133324 RepID=UPI003F625091